MSRTRKLPPFNGTNIRVSNLSVGLSGIRGAPGQLYPRHDENGRFGGATFGLAAVPGDGDLSIKVARRGTTFDECIRRTSRGPQRRNIVP